MEKVYTCGTGHAYVQVPRAEILRLENMPITLEDATLFLQWQQIPLTIEFSERNTKQRWGTAWPKEGRIILYRHSIWTFLHEVAHIVAGPGQHHAGDFPAALRGLYIAWKQLES